MAQIIAILFEDKIEESYIAVILEGEEPEILFMIPRFSRTSSVSYTLLLGIPESSATILAEDRPSFTKEWYAFASFFVRPRLVRSPTIVFWVTIITSSLYSSEL